MSRDKSLPEKIYRDFEDAGIDLIYYDCTDSTNRRAREHAAYGEVHRPVLFVADSQTEGRGRLGRSFYSPDSTGLYMTLLMKAPEGRAFALLTSVAAVVSRRIISRMTGVDTRIKWVNDLYFDGRKVAGILAESFSGGDERYVALGLGINLTTAVFPEEISDVAGALMSGRDGSPEELFADRLAMAFLISKELIKAMTETDLSAYMNEYREASCVIGREIEFTENGRVFCGRALDINSDGSLKVLTDSGERTLAGGEISLKVKDKR